jgi:acetyl esterase
LPDTLRASADVLTPSSAHPVLDPSVQQVVDQRHDRAAPPLRGQPLAGVRRALAFDQLPQGPRLDAHVTDLTLSLKGDQSIAIRIVRPPHPDSQLPVVLYLHGGGWIMGDRETHDRLMRELAVGAGAAVVFVDYALAPEVRYPAQNEQAYAALCALVDQAQGLGLDATRLAVAGDGAGGAIAAAVTLMAKARNGPALLGQLLFYPITAAVSDNSSYTAFASGPGPTRDDMRYCQESLLGAFDDAETSAFVLDIPLRQLCGLPPTLVITAEADVVRDEGEAYARKLMRAGVPVTALRVSGVIHDFVTIEALRDVPAVRAAIAQATLLLRSIFQRPPADLAAPG